MIEYLKGQVNETISKEEVVGVLKTYADMIKRSVEETAIRDHNKSAEVFAQKSEDEKYYLLTSLLVDAFKEQLKGISSGNIQDAKIAGGNL